MSLTLAQFLRGIAQEESGGSYSARNRTTGAIGKYQVMPSNVAAWTKRALGYPMTPAQFAASPAAQEKVAQVILGGYFRQYGAEGAAAMWFSGQPDPNHRASDGNNTVREYVDKVMAAAGGSPSGGGGAAVGGSVAPLDTAALADSYGLSAALINSNKELKNLFKQAVKGSWSADVFTAKLKNTKWWSTQSDTLRQYITLKYTDPATYKQNYNNAWTHVNQLAVQVGLPSQIYAGGKTGTNLLAQATYNSLALGWSDDRIKDWLGTKVSTHGGAMYGEAGDAFDKLHSLAYTNGIKLSSSWYTTAARSIVSGTGTQEQYEAQIRQQAAAKYSAFADQIKAGQNVIDLASPYIQDVSKILEVPDTDVDLFNSHVSKAMTYNKGGQSYSLWQFENDLRADPLWKKTQNAQDSAMSTAHQVLTQFGLVF